jgi:RNA polymerase sigma factor (sigma-70 family)
MLQERRAPIFPAEPANALGFASGRSRQAKHFSSQGGPNYRTKPEPEQTGLRKPQGSSLDQAIRLAQEGDAVAFEHIYRLHSRRVYSLCRRMARDPVEAEDLTQEAFLQLFRKIHTFRGESAFSSWLYRLTANVVLMTFRKKKLATDWLESPAETETADQIAAIYAQLGGQGNADTQQNITQYFTTVAAADLEIALRVDAACMQDIHDSQEEWAQEKGAIEQEVARDLSNPTYKFLTRLNADLFSGMVHSHDALGTKDSFEATTGAMLKKFYQDWYAPNNAILVIAGDVDANAVLAKVQDLYGNIKRRPVPVIRKSLSNR